MFKGIVMLKIRSSGTNFLDNINRHGIIICLYALFQIQSSLDDLLVYDMLLVRYCHNSIQNAETLVDDICFCKDCHHYILHGLQTCLHIRHFRVGHTAHASGRNMIEVMSHQQQRNVDQGHIRRTCCVGTLLHIADS